MTAEWSHSPVDYDPFENFGELHVVVPSTEPQREIWGALLIHPEANLAFNESITIDLRGPLELDVVRATLNALCEIHDALRSSFSADGLMLCVHKNVKLELREVDLQNTGKLNEALKAEKIRETNQPFDLVHGPLIRFCLIKLAEHYHSLMVTGHHIILDGWSFALLVKDIFQIYGQLRQGLLPPKAGHARMSDYALARSQENNDHCLEYWIQKYQTVPILELPLKSMRPPQRSFRAEAYFKRFDVTLIRALKAASRKEKSSFSNFVLSAFSLALSQITGQKDLVIGLPAAGQVIFTQPECVGHCVHLLPLRYKIPSGSSWQEYLATCRCQFIDDWRHNRVTFGSLVPKLGLSRDPSRMPLVQVVFNIDTKIQAKQLTDGQLSADYVINPRQYESFEMFINCVDTDEAFEICCQYNADLFGEEHIDRIFVGLERILQQIERDPQLKINQLTICDESQVAKVNRHEKTWSDGLNFLDYVARQALATPKKTAIFSGQACLSYEELALRSDHFARRLWQEGVRSGDLVGVCLPRDENLVVSLIAIMKIGAAYVPLDPAFPIVRLNMIVEDARLKFALVTPKTKDILSPNLTKIDRDTLAGTATANLPVLPELPSDSERLAYVIFTSGSTGRPKGVMISQKAMGNFLLGMSQAIEFQPDHRILAVTTASFDISVLEFFLPLTHGASLVMAADEDVKDGYRLKELIAQHRVNALQATPAGWKILMYTGFRPDPGFLAICGGEALPRSLAEELLSHKMVVWNAYGPTEATVWASVYQIKNANSPILVGKVLPNYEAWILDAEGRVLPFACKGELALGGVGLAVGYYGRRDLTTEKFFLDAKGRPLYRTGDVARLLPDGNIELFGRNDAQIKLRGYRIELDEIKLAIESLADIKEAIVLIREMAGEPQIVAYVRVADISLKERAILDSLKSLLPLYMLPHACIILESFPLLPNGKMDRKSLPDPLKGHAAPSSGDFSPKNDAQKILLKLWNDSLKTKTARGSDDFFVLGGHSLLAMQLLARLNEELHTDLRIHHLFANPTLTALAALLEPSTDSVVATPIPKRDAQDQRVSVAQRRMWFVESINEGTKVHNLPGAWRMGGTYDHKTFQSAFDLLLRRHDALRMTVVTVGNEPRQQVEDRLFSLPLIDLSRETEPLTSCQKMMQQAAARHMPLDTFPLFIAQVYRLAADDHVLFFMPHHIVWDGWCFDIFLEEIDACYRHLTRGTPLPPQAPCTYGDYSSWQAERTQSPVMAETLAYWQNIFKTVPDLLELPQDVPRPQTFTQEAGVVSLSLSQALVADLEQFCARYGFTPYMVILGLYALSLKRFAQQDEVVVGSPVRGRGRSEFERVMGLFINVVPLRIVVDESRSLLGYLQDICQICTDAWAHDELPIELLMSKLAITRDQSRSPLYSAILSYQDVSARVRSFGDLKLNQVLVHSPIAPTDQFFWVKKGGENIELGLDYYKGLWREPTAKSFLATVRHLLEVALGSPDAKLSSFSSVSRQAFNEMKQQQGPLVREFSHRSVALLLASHTEYLKQETAIYYKDKQYSYEWLWRRAGDVAAKLRGHHLKPGEFVGIYMERSENLVAAMLGTLLAGGAYLPLDPQYPADRIEYMISDSATRLVLVDGDLADSLPEAAGVEAIAVDEISKSEFNIQPGAVDLGDAAYMIYTSGSTGRPKGVIISQGAMINFLLSMRERVGFPPRMATLAVTTISFDISVLEIFSTLLEGGSIHLLSTSQAMDGQKIRQILESRPIDLLQATPVTWRLILDSAWQGKTDLTALTGGEALPADLADRLVPRVAALYNVYGPTEATVWATAALIRNGEFPILIGKALPYYHVYILNEQRQPCATGMPGDLFLAGPSLATAYHNQPTLTAQRFIKAPWDSELTLYETGDRARWHHLGELQYLRRADTQVKLRGFRIELEEIEKRLMEQPRVERAVVIVREDRPGDQRLVAYYVANEGLDAKELSKELAIHLPRYMLPNAFVHLAALPLTANGKIDRKKLPVPEATPGTQKKRVSARTQSEKLIATIWQDLLATKEVFVDDNFFDVGGHSLLAIRAIQEIRRVAGKEILVRDFLLSNLEQLAASVEERKS